MAITQATTWLMGVFNNTYFLGSEYIIQMMFILLTLAIITRDLEDWKILAFPICLGWLYAGIHINFTIFTVLFIIWVINTLSVRVISNTLSGAVSSGEYLLSRMTLPKGSQRMQNLQLERKAMNYSKQLSQQKKKLGFTMPEAIKELGKKTNAINMEQQARQERLNEALKQQAQYRQNQRAYDTEVANMQPRRVRTRDDYKYGMGAMRKGMEAGNYARRMIQRQKQKQIESAKRDFLERNKRLRRRRRLGYDEE